MGSRPARPYGGQSWTTPDWYAVRIDRLGRLGHQERVEAAETALQRTHTVALVHPDEDVWHLGLVEALRIRVEHQVELREPIPEVEPVDLDEVLS